MRTTSSPAAAQSDDERQVDDHHHTGQNVDHDSMSDAPRGVRATYRQH
jgi:hypothetical protein